MNCEEGERIRWPKSHASHLVDTGSSSTEAKRFRWVGRRIRQGIRLTGRLEGIAAGISVSNGRCGTNMSFVSFGQLKDSSKPTQQELP
jgi:hypothetical protein